MGSSRHPYAEGARPGTDRDVRGFGVVMVVGLALTAWAAHRRGLPAAACGAVAGLGVALALLAWAAPAAARPVYAAWMALGRALGRVTTPVLLGAVFVLVLVPTRLVLALVGADPLGARFDPGAPSYWVARARPTFAREDFDRLW